MTGVGEVEIAEEAIGLGKQLGSESQLAEIMVGEGEAIIGAGTKKVLIDSMNSQLDRFLAAENERNARDAEYFIRGQIMAICESVLAEEIGVIAGSRRLNRLGLQLYGARDSDFITFVGVDSETDHLRSIQSAQTGVPKLWKEKTGRSRRLRKFTRRLYSWLVEG